MVTDRDLLVLMRTISDGDHTTATRLLRVTPEIGDGTTRHEFHGRDGGRLLPRTRSSAGVRRRHRLARRRGCVRHRSRAQPARRRRRASDQFAAVPNPIHEAVTGGPGSQSWAPDRQAAILRCLVEAGADPDATAKGGVTPLLRAVRNRCSAAVRELLDLGADPTHENDNGSSARDLARMSTGRGGTGSPEAKAEQARIIAMLETIVGTAADRPHGPPPRA